MVWMSIAESLQSVLVGLGAESHLSPTHFCSLPAIGACAVHEVLSGRSGHGVTGARGTSGSTLGDRERPLYLSWEVEDKKE